MDLSSLGAASAGVWTRCQALAVTTRGRIAASLRDGYWQQPYPSVYADGGSELAPEQRGFAAVLASGGAEQDPAVPRAVAAGRTAARIWDLPLIDDDDPATGAREVVCDDIVAASSRTTRYGDLVLARHQWRLDSADVQQRTSGLLVTTVRRTLFDCAGLLSFEATVCALDAALQRRLITPSELAAEARDRRGMPGAPAFRRAVAASDGRSESPAETLTRLLLLPHLPGLVPQVELWDQAARLVARFDLGDEQARFAVEADGKRGHAGSQMVAKDRRRDRRSVSFGWATERVTWFELRRQQAALTRRVLGAYADHVRTDA